MRDLADLRVSQGHDVRRMQLYDGTELHTTIYSDFTKQEVLVENHVQDPDKTLFGGSDSPSWEEFQVFAQKRCRLCLEEDIKAYLAELGMDEGCPLIIVQRESERLNADQGWIRLELLH